MIEVEIKKICPSFFNRGKHGYKVLQYETIAGTRYLCGSRTFEEMYEAEWYKNKIEEREARKGLLEDV